MTSTSVAETTNPSAPRSIVSWIVNAVVSFAVLAACVFGYTFLGERKRPERTKPAKSSVTIVTTEPMRLHEGPVPIAANGVVVPLREIRLATEVTGRIIEQSANLRPGRTVDAGEVLIRLDPAEYELEVRRLQAQAAQEKSEIAAADIGIENTKQLSQLAEQQVRLAQTDAERVSSLVTRQAASASEVDLARRAELTAKSALVELENRRRELTAQRQLIVDKQALTSVQLERARLDLARCVVRSPIQGVVAESSVEEQSFIAIGTPFVTIEDTSATEVRVNLTSNQMVWVWSSSDTQNDSGDNDARDVPARNGTRVPGIAATVTRDFGNDVFTWSAVLERIDGAGIDAATRTYPCLFRVAQPLSTLSGVGTRRLTRGMFVDLTIAAAPERVLHQVSESAIRPGNRVWLDVDGRLRIVPITVVSRLEDRLVIELPASELPEMISEPSNIAVITSPISDPTEGMAVGVEELSDARISSEFRHALPTRLVSASR